MKEVFRFWWSNINFNVIRYNDVRFVFNVIDGVNFIVVFLFWKKINCIIFIFFFLYYDFLGSIVFG